MRIMKKGGLAPCDRRLDRRKVTLAATAVLCLCVTSARADLYDFVINPALSTVKVKSVWNLSAFKVGTQTWVAQQPGSDIANYYGNVYADITGTPALGTLQLLPGSSIRALDYAGGAPALVPSELPNGKVNPAGLPATNGNYGTTIGLVGAFQLIGRQKFDILAPANPVMAVVGNSFNEAGNTWGSVEGFSDIISALGAPSHTALATFSGGLPYPLPLATGTVVTTGTTGAVGTWDGTTLTIVVNSVLDYVISGVIPVHEERTGVIVATPRVPEPSSLTLLGFGTVGLLSYAWRARKRRALTA